MLRLIKNPSANKMLHGYRYDEKGDFFSSYLERQHIGVTGHFTTAISADFYLRHLI